MNSVLINGDSRFLVAQDLLRVADHFWRMQPECGQPDGQTERQTDVGCLVVHFNGICDYNKSSGQFCGVNISEKTRFFSILIISDGAFLFEKLDGFFS